MNKSAATLHRLRELAYESAQPWAASYSGNAAGAAVLLSDGRWVRGTRVESATFPLTIPALQAAFVGAASMGRRDIVAAAQHGYMEPGAWAWLAVAVGATVRNESADLVSFQKDLPAPADELQVRHDAGPPADDFEGVALAREVAEHAHAPYSNYQVGCILLYEGEDGQARLVPGVNVEHPDWTRGLCAERSAIAAALSSGRGQIRRAYLSCPTDPTGIPCGACRQLLAEHLPDAALVMDRGPEPPERSTARDLLPRFFSGESLRG